MEPLLNGKFIIIIIIIIIIITAIIIVFEVCVKCKKRILCRIWGFHGGDYEECRLLECDVVWVL
jgi:hypothetical protein